MVKREGRGRLENLQFLLFRHLHSISRYNFVQSDTPGKAGGL